VKGVMIEPRQGSFLVPFQRLQQPRRHFAEDIIRTRAQIFQVSKSFKVAPFRDIDGT